MLSFSLAVFSLKKSIRDYQKRLSFLENASFDNRKAVNKNYHFLANILFLLWLQVKKNILTTGSGKVVIAAVIM